MPANIANGYFEALKSAHDYGFMGAKAGGQLAVNNAYGVQLAYAKADGTVKELVAARAKLTASIAK